jgi:hypothetical protein
MEEEQGEEEDMEPKEEEAPVVGDDDIEPEPELKAAV